VSPGRPIRTQKEEGLSTLPLGARVERRVEPGPLGHTGRHVPTPPQTWRRPAASRTANRIDQTVALRACQSQPLVNLNRTLPPGGAAPARGVLTHGPVADTGRLAVPDRDTGHNVGATQGARTMKHASSRELFSYWNQRRGIRTAPERGDIEPGAIRAALGDTFILSDDPAGGHCFRLAGTRVCALFGRELRGEAFTALWAASSRPAVRDLVAAVGDEPTGVVAGASGRTAEGFANDLELLLLPLHHRGRTGIRMIGVLSPLAPPVWLGSSRLEGIALGSLRHVGPGVEATPAPRFAAPAGPSQPRRGFVVYEGGRS
jgi:hypothetical protein